MSARVINPNQLAMLMTGSELQAHLTDSLDRAPQKGGSRETMAEMWTRKETQSRQPGSPALDGPGVGVYNALKTEGWNPPSWHPRGGSLSVFHGTSDVGPDEHMISNGHHRVAAAAALEREGHGPVYIPVAHKEM